MPHIMRCRVCNKYTMQTTHCGKETIRPRPPKYSPEDKYGAYRRKVKYEMEHKD